MASEPNPIDVARIQKRLQTKYDSILHFYFARKTRNFIRKKPKTHDLILFEDYLCLDADDEFLKRPYKLDEIPDRIKLLAAYFKRNRVLPGETPFLLEPSARKLLGKRTKRRLKATTQVKEFEQRDGDPVRNQGSFLEEVSSRRLEASDNPVDNNVSYQTRLYDIYTNSFSSHPSLTSLSQPPITGLMPLPLIPEQSEIKNVKDKEVDHLICNFNDKDVERIMSEYMELKENQQIGYRPLTKKAANDLSDLNLKLKLNLTKLSKDATNRSDQQKTIYEKFYEQVKKKQEQRKPGKVYYVKGAQKNYQVSPRSPQSGAIITPRDYENNRQRVLTSDRFPSERIFVKSMSPELGKAEQRFPSLFITHVDRQPTDRRQTEKIPSNRNTDREIVDQPVLTDRTGERQNHYKRILDRMRENKKLEMQVRGNSNTNLDREEKSKKIQKLKEKAAQLLSSSKSQARLYLSPQHYRNPQK